MGRCSEPANISKRNANVVAALITNFSTAEAALDSAANSTGSALAENDKYLDSINGRIAKLSATFETLSAHFVDTDFIKGIISLGTNAVSVLDALVSKLGVVPAAVSAIVTAVAGLRAAKGKETGIFDITGFVKPGNGATESILLFRHSISEYVSAIRDINKVGVAPDNIFDTIGWRIDSFAKGIHSVTSGLTGDIDTYNQLKQKLDKAQSAFDKETASGSNKETLDRFAESLQNTKDVDKEFSEAIKK